MVVDRRRALLAEFVSKKKSRRGCAIQNDLFFASGDAARCWHGSLDSKSSTAPAVMLSAMLTGQLAHVPPVPPAWRATQLAELGGQVQGAPPCLSSLTKVGRRQGQRAAWLLSSYQGYGSNVKTQILGQGRLLVGTLGRC